MVQESKKIKILYTIPNFDTAGSGKAVLKVAQNLDTRKFEPHIMCMHGRGEYFKVVENSGIPVHLVQYTCPMKPYLKGLWNCFMISRKLKKIAPDIIHSFHYGADYSEPLSAKLAGIKWVYTKKNMNWDGSSQNGWKLRTFLATAIIAQNIDMMHRFFGNKKNIYLISRGVDTEEFSPVKQREDLKIQWNIGDKDRILMCIANLVPIKGIHILINAFANISNTYKHWKILIVGDSNTAYGRELQELTIQLGLQKRVFFTGKQQNIREYLSLAEVFALPTLAKGEGSPVALLEAMACGKNVLASKIPGVKDQLEDFPEHLIEAENLNAWRLALSQVFSNDSEVNSNLGKLFREHVLKNFGLENEVTKCEQLYLQIR